MIQVINQRSVFLILGILSICVSYLHGDLLDQVPQVWVIKGNVVLRSPVHNQLPQHGALLSDLFGQTAGVYA